MKFLTLLCVFLCLLYEIRTTCVMRGECVELNGSPKPCPYNGEALPLFQNISTEDRDIIFNSFLHRCPQFVLDDEGNIKPDDEIVTCCDTTQLSRMFESLLLADGIIGRCPTCVRNFVRQICEMNCSPEQSRFVDVYTETTADGIEYVYEVDYRMHEDFMVESHASCAGVIVPQTGVPAINLMCGNAQVCDPESWYGYSGDTVSNPFVDLQVNFLKWPTTEDSMNARALPCNETAEGDIPCSCADCFASCPAGTEPVLPEVCTVLNVNCVGLSIGLIFCTSIILIFTFLTFKEKRKRPSPNDKSNKPTEVNNVTRAFQEIFAGIGKFSASNPQLVIMLTSWLAFGMFFGVMQLKLTTDPIELWSAEDSRSRTELNYFNSRFGPFYRAAQVYMQFKGLEPFTMNNVTYGPAFRIEAVTELIRLEDAIFNIGRDDGEVTLEEVCYAPLRKRSDDKEFDQCVIMSVGVYFKDNRNNINNNTYLNTIQNCMNNYLSLDCLATWGGGADPLLSFGGFDDDDILSADTLLINLPIANHLLKENLEPALEWELKFIELLHDYAENWKADFVDVSFAAERSIEDEIERVSVAEIGPIAISYLLMFLYVTISLGNVRYCKTWFVDSKITVAIASIFIEIVAIFCAVGVMGYSGTTLSLLVLNVIPFFVLSVGIDNVFLMVNTLHDIENELKSYDDFNPNFSFERRKYVFGKMLGKVGPSMFVASITQITCFAIGSLTKFPAVVTFAVFASVSLGFLFVFQITTIVAILSFDYKRTTQNRFDIFCCVQKKILNDDDPLNSEVRYTGVIKKLMKPYAKFILKWWMKLLIIAIFMVMLCTSIVLIPQLEIGLDQEMALPVDSYVYKYLQAVAEALKLGPPVYFVLKGGLNFSNPDHQNVVCGGQVCNDDSLYIQVYLASLHSDITYIARSSNSWLDDFIDWSGLYGSCCKYNVTDGSFCQSTDNSPECAYCEIDRSEWQNGLRPAGEAFEKYIPFFLQDTPTDACSKGGLASYFSNVNYVLDAEGRATVQDSNFMAYHNALSTSTDYITAVKYGYEISANISEAIKRNTGIDVEVFPYSIFYVFFEQYLTMWADTFASIGYCLIGAFVFNLLASGFNWLTTIAVMFSALLVVINMMGVMYIWSIPLNAVSCINLIVSIGIAVEFCSHIAYAYAISKETQSQEARVIDALKSVGSTIITGITFTNIPIIVLAFSYTEIIEVFFFRMFLSLVILGLLHGMVFLPVLLCYLGNLKSDKKTANVQ